MKRLVFLLLPAVAFLSCKDEITVQEQFDKDQKIIENYLEKNDINAKTDPDYGLYYVIQTQGTGLRPKVTNQVNVSYVGTKLDGEVFDRNDNINFDLAGLIRGWQILLPYLREGGTMTMYIPRYYAYDKEILIFDISLHDVQ
ncbi:MAG: FKBP-type peptidyl-prolyl cis-trans isomerase [Cyclobacteriaceae bacterium]|uniref:FKBP-type peptidyl-prolyl cis-trans isomerase n=1 Tax=Nonlabens ulvanivorans TaxID=906888 RepID=UPI00327ADF1C